MSRIPSSGLSIGVDLGGTQVRAALVDASGNLIARASDKTDKLGGPNSVVLQMIALIEAVSRDVGLESIQAVGVSAPGPLDAKEGLILNIPTLPGWVDIPIRDLLSDAIKKPVVLENDGVAAAIGEWRFGAGKGHTDFVYVTVSTGIGGGVVADGRVLRGRRQLAGHIGHMTTLPNGERCTCGNQGCWEAQASGTALGKYARFMASELPSSSLARHGDGLGAKEVFDDARLGDAAALKIVARESKLLGVGIINLLHLYSPEMVVVGGGVSNGFDLLSDGISQHIRAHALPAFREVPVVKAALGTDSGLIGAASLGAEYFSQSLT